MLCHCFDEGVEPFCDHIDVVICRWVVFLVVHDGFAEGDSGIYLVARGECGFKDFDSDAFDFIRGRRGETREVFLNLVGCRAGCLLANTPFER